MSPSTHLVLRFFRGERGGVIAKHGKICLVSRNSHLSPQPGEEWVCRILADEGNLYRVMPETLTHQVRWALVEDEHAPPVLGVKGFQLKPEDPWYAGLNLRPPADKAAREDEPIPVETWWKLSSTSTLDAVWSLRAAEPIEEAHIMAIRVMVAAARTAEHLLFADARVACLAAIQAAEEWLKEPTEERARAADEAADAAHAAAFHDDELAYCATLAAICTTDATRAVRAAEVTARIALRIYAPTPAHISADAAIRAALIA